MKIRILVAVTEDGTWKAFGFGRDGVPAETDNMLIEDAFNHFDDGLHFVWVEAELPHPLPIQVVQGTTTSHVETP